MNARCKTQILALGRNTKEMTENNGAEAVEVGPGGTDRKSQRRKMRWLR